LPRALARSSPDRIRSPIKARSNWPIAAITWNISSTRRRGGVDVFLERDEAGAAAAEVLEGLNELLHGAGCSIKPLDDDDLRQVLAWMELVEKLLNLRQSIPCGTRWYSSAQD
jgi:hypothetical protein